MYILLLRSLLHADSSCKSHTPKMRLKRMRSRPRSLDYTARDVCSSVCRCVTSMRECVCSGRHHASHYIGWLRFMMMISSSSDQPTSTKRCHKGKIHGHTSAPEQFAPFPQRPLFPPSSSSCQPAPSAPGRTISVQMLAVHSVNTLAIVYDRLRLYR